MILLVFVVVSFVIGFSIGRNLKIIVYFDHVERLQKELTYWHGIASRQNEKPNWPPCSGSREI